APFSVTTLLLPGQQALDLQPTQTSGVLELILTSDRPIRAHAWKAEHRHMEILVYCDATNAAELEDFRLLGIAPWTVEGQPWDGFRSGVSPAVGAPGIWRSPVGKHLGRAQPMFAGRFLRIPVESWMDHASAQVRFRVHLGSETARVAKSLANRLL